VTVVTSLSFKRTSNRAVLFTKNDWNQESRFSPATERLLLLAGWTPGRQISIQEDVPNTAAIKVLCEFGGLVVGPGDAGGGRSGKIRSLICSMFGKKVVTKRLTNPLTVQFDRLDWQNFPKGSAFDDGPNSSVSCWKVLPMAVYVPRSASVF